MIEASLRRDGFTIGRTFVGNDGQLWAFPVLDEESYDRFSAIRDAIGLVERLSGSDGTDGTSIMEEAGPHMGTLLVQMLASNYRITYDECVAVARGIESAFIGVIEAFREQLSTFNAYHMADKLGLDRGETKAILEMPIADIRLRGLTDHDGCLFLN